MKSCIILSSCCCASNLSLSRNNISFIIDHHRHIWIYQLYRSKRRRSINKSSTIIIIRWRYILTNEDFFHHQRENLSKFHYENDGKILSFHIRQKTSEMKLKWWNFKNVKFKDKTRWRKINKKKTNRNSFRLKTLAFVVFVGFCELFDFEKE